MTSEIKDHYIKEERERIIAELEELKVAICVDMTMAELNWNRAISKAIEIVRGGSEIKYDSETQKWFDKQLPNQQTTVVMCEKCRLFYKPSLGHKCERR